MTFNGNIDEVISTSDFCDGGERESRLSVPDVTSGQKPAENMTLVEGGRRPAGTRIIVEGDIERILIEDPKTDNDDERARALHELGVKIDQEETDLEKSRMEYEARSAKRRTEIADLYLKIKELSAALKRGDVSAGPAPADPVVQDGVGSAGQLPAAPLHIVVEDNIEFIVLFDVDSDKEDGRDGHAEPDIAPAKLSTAEPALPDALAAEQALPDALAAEPALPDTSAAEQALPDALAAEQALPDASAGEHDCLSDFHTYGEDEFPAPYQSPNSYEEERRGAGPCSEYPVPYEPSYSSEDDLKSYDSCSEHPISRESPTSHDQDQCEIAPPPVSLQEVGRTTSIRSASPDWDEAWGGEASLSAPTASTAVPQPAPQVKVEDAEPSVSNIKLRFRKIREGEYSLLPANPAPVKRVRSMRELKSLHRSRTFAQGECKEDADSSEGGKMDYLEEFKKKIRSMDFCNARTILEKKYIMKKTLCEMFRVREEKSNFASVFGDEFEYTNFLMDHLYSFMMRNNASAKCMAKFQKSDIEVIPLIKKQIDGWSRRCKMNKKWASDTAEDFIAFAKFLTKSVMQGRDLYPEDPYFGCIKRNGHVFFHHFCQLVEGLEGGAAKPSD